MRSIPFDMAFLLFDFAVDFIFFFGFMGAGLPYPLLILFIIDIYGFLDLH
jgi:hypothetical protein